MICILFAMAVFSLSWFNFTPIGSLFYIADTVFHGFNVANCIQSFLNYIFLYLCFLVLIRRYYETMNLCFSSQVKMLRQFQTIRLVYSFRRFVLRYRREHCKMLYKMIKFNTYIVSGPLMITFLSIVPHNVQIVVHIFSNRVSSGPGMLFYAWIAIFQGNIIVVLGWLFIVLAEQPRKCQKILFQCFFLPFKLNLCFTF